MYTIQLNESGTRHLDLTEENLRTLHKYKLLDGLIDSTGYVTEEALNKLKLSVRSLIARSEDDREALLNVCIDVVYHDKMKAFGLRNLIEAYRAWQAQCPAGAEAGASVEAPSDVAQ